MEVRLKEEFLTCIICHEVFREPVTLSCGHSFCTDCVTSYTKTQQDAVARQSLPCPHCRGVTCVPDPTKPVEEWAGQLKTGFFIRDLVETFVAESKDPECVPCKQAGDTNPAVVWCADCKKALCQDCQKSHRKLMSEHTVTDLSEASTVGTPSPKPARMCLEHPDSPVDMMCEDCDVAACPRCCFAYHRKCNSVVSLKEALPKIIAVLEECSHKLNSEMDQLQAFVPKRKSEVERVLASAAKAERAITTANEKLVAKVTQREMANLTELKNNAVAQLQGDIKASEMKLQLAQQNKGLVRQALQSSSEMDQYEMYKTCKNIMQSHNIPPPPRIIELELDDNVGKESSLSFQTERERLKKTYDKKWGIDTAVRAVLTDQIDTKQRSDATVHVLYDFCLFLVKDKAILVASDRDNNCLKSFNLEKKEFLSCLQLQDSPHTLVRISKSTGATAQRLGKQICVFSVTSDLVLERTIKTEKAYVGLGYLSSTLLVASSLMPSVDVIDMDGNILRSLCPTIFACPCYISVDGPNRILVSDWSKASLSCVTHLGEVKFVYQTDSSKTLSFPRGVVRSAWGDYFLVDRDRNKVIQMTVTGEFVRDVLTSQDGLEAPMAICVDDNNRMYVSTKGRYINIYSFVSA